jgi:uncharacterized protein (TIGR03437 family)
MLFIDSVIARSVALARLLALDFLAAHQLRNDAVDLVVLVCGLLAGAGNDQRRARFVHQNGVDFVDDRELVAALDAILQAELHVVAQIIESVLVVGPVGDVGVVGVVALLVVQIVDDDTDREAKKLVNAAHPLGIALGQVIVDGDDMHAFTGERVQVNGKRGDQRFSFAGSHFSDPASVQDNTADQLHVEVPHVENAAAGFAAHGEGLDQQVVERLAVGDPLLEFHGFLGQVGVGELLELRFDIVDGGDKWTEPLNFAFVPGPEDFRKSGVEHGRGPGSILADLANFVAFAARKIKSARVGNPRPLEVPMFIRWFWLFLCSGLSFAATSATAPTFPELTYSTYLRDNFTPAAIATDSSGNIYMAGTAIVDPSISQTTALVVKLSPQTGQYVYVRFLGGSVYDSADAIAVDAAGNAYVAGTTGSPDFPVTSGGKLGTAPAGITGKRSFVMKLDPSGELAFSDLLGGSAASQAQAVAVNANGEILVSGISESSGFPTTAGAYSIANSANHPYLLELDPAGRKIIFSATGIGGSSVALGPSGNIYVAGTTFRLDYPTTPGTYQPTLPMFNVSGSSDAAANQGANQYVTKVDSTGSKLIFSTAVSGTGNTTNTGLAVDASGVYLTGLAGPGYPHTVAPPTLPSLSASVISASPFVSKLDTAGQKLLFSVPAGGAGVQVDSNGSSYVGGVLGWVQESFLPGPNFLYYLVTTNLPALANVPVPCLPKMQQESAYITQVDSTSGDVLGAKFIGGSTLNVAAVAISGSKVWVGGATDYPDFPFSPNALTLSSPYLSDSFLPGPLPGAYLGAVDFSAVQPPAGTPQIGCVVDAADFAYAGPVSSYQLLTIFGTGLGPTTGVTATDNSSTSLAGVSVNFGDDPAPLLYVSSIQINLAVPGYIFPASTADPASGPIQVTVDGSPSHSFNLPSSFVNPSLFASSSIETLALNGDGSVNSRDNPAALGSTISVFVNGLSNDFLTDPPQLTSAGGWFVTNVVQATPFVLQVDLQVPSAVPPYSSCSPTNVCYGGFEIYNVAPSGQHGISGQSLGGSVWISRTR